MVNVTWIGSALEDLHNNSITTVNAFMIKYFLLIFIAFSLICCKTESEADKYFGQVMPDSIPQVFAPNIISVKGRFEQGFSISPDNHEILFGVIGQHDTLNCIYLVTLVNDTMSKPMKPDFIDNDDSVFFPMYSPDNQKITFTKRCANSMQTDIWYCEKEDNKWSKPKQFPACINSQFREGSSCLSINNTLFFTSNRDTAYKCCGDVYSSEFNKNSYDSIERLININSIYDEEGVFISPNEDYIIVQSWKTDYKTKHDLYISYKMKNNTWSDLIRLDSIINTVDLEQRPFVSYDNKFLFFNRYTLDSNFNSVESDIYWVSTKKVFKPFIFNPMPDTSIVLGKTINLRFPQDMFKDIDDDNLNYSIEFQNKAVMSWLHYNSRKQRISGVPDRTGVYTIILTATDESGNSSQGIFSIAVK